MADLSIKIKADVQSAIKQFDELARSSEAVQKQITITANKFKTESTEKFIAKQQLAGAALMATKGEMAALTSQAGAYQREIERLIKSGISPEDSAVTKLKDEYDKLTATINTNTRAKKAQEAAVKGAAAALGGLYPIK